ncbi:type I-E CRISPR-associated protein Cse1/CasA [Enemella evansiae]|uniref:type I-E CRISPR-associated protein Cse1/CasA n=1 Tax=Enemella evansiae TaxID=2016499 RepID=UPI000B9663C7|nr:type I-E CRISPR-associated protein Cse1/CasA [Enemella evansiae]OYO16967.1 type I-E CRISPR-associated protein Cse1/CasA [Enemella evansiae]
MSFNLVDEPWVLVQTTEGPDELSLAQLFARADSIRAITGEIPTQGFAILRVLLAICHDAIGWHTNKAIRSLHDSGIDLDRIQDYLIEHHDVFDLFHPQRPFMQVAGLRTTKDEHSGLEKLIADVPNGSPFFTTRAGRGLDKISAAEAARWLVHVQAFDPSGIRSGAVGDILSKGGRGYPIGPSWAGQIGGIVLHGDNLRETLVNNISVTRESLDDRPVWALATPHTSEREEESMPAGPVQTLVWQSRRVRLVGDREGVRGVVLAQGDKVVPQRMLGIEPMTAWRYSKPQSKSFGRPVYMPNQHEAGRAMWRGLPALIAAGAEQIDDNGSKFDRFQTPDTVRVADERDATYVAQAVGIQYGPQKAVIEELIDDRMELPGVLLIDGGTELQVTVTDGVDNADTCVRALGQLAANIARAAGERGDDAGDGARQRAMAEAWAALDQPARAWVASISADSDPLEVLRAWQTQVQRIMQDHARILVDRAGPAAIRGRQTNFGYLSAHKAYSFFLRDLRKELSTIQPTKKETANG